MLASRTHPQQLMTLEEMANVAGFVASEKASGLTRTTINLTRGSLDDISPVRRISSGDRAIEAARR